MESFPQFASDLLDELKKLYPSKHPESLLGMPDRQLGFYLGQRALIANLERLQEATKEDELQNNVLSLST